MQPHVLGAHIIHPLLPSNKRLSSVGTRKCHHGDKHWIAPVLSWSGKLLNKVGWTEEHKVTWRLLCSSAKRYSSLTSQRQTGHGGVAVNLKTPLTIFTVLILVTWRSLMFGKGIPMVTTARALSSVKSSPSLTFPLHTAISSAPSPKKEITKDSSTL